MGFGWRMSALAFVLAGSCAWATGAADWENSITAGAPGSFPPLRPLTATYHFGWAGFTAATAEVQFASKSGNRFELNGAGRTVGLVRALWNMDVTHRAVADSSTLRPIEVEQVEKVRSKTIKTDLTFNGTGVTRIRQDTKDQSGKPKTREFKFPDLYDLHSAMLYTRSLPLRNGSVQRLVVYPASSAYLVTLTVLGREKLSVRAGTFQAIKLDLRLSKVGKNNQLEPHRKFRRATVWVSDDADRLLLRVDAQIFVGSVFAELQSVTFKDQ